MLQFKITASLGRLRNLHTLNVSVKDEQPDDEHAFMASITAPSARTARSIKKSVSRASVDHASAEKYATALPSIRDLKKLAKACPSLKCLNWAGRYVLVQHFSCPR